MAASLSLADVVARWPVGTSVGAYTVDSFPASWQMAGAPPAGVSAVESATVDAGGDLAFGALVFATRYRLGASVGGEWRWLHARTVADPATDEVTAAELAAKQDASSAATDSELAAHAALTTAAHGGVVARPGSPVAVTQTYATAAAVNPALTAVAVSGADSAVLLGDVLAVIVAQQSAINALIADVTAVKKLENTVVDALQAAGVLA